MNIIDAWKAARIGQKVKCGPNFIIKSARADNLSEFLWREVKGDYSIVGRSGRTTDEYILADDWEVVKEEKTVEVEMIEIKYHNRQTIIWNSSDIKALPQGVKMKAVFTWSE